MQILHLLIHSFICEETQCEHRTRPPAELNLVRARTRASDAAGRLGSAHGLLQSGGLLSLCPCKRFCSEPARLTPQTCLGFLAQTFQAVHENGKRVSLGEKGEIIINHLESQTSQVAQW